MVSVPVAVSMSSVTLDVSCRSPTTLRPVRKSISGKASARARKTSSVRYCGKPFIQSVIIGGNFRALEPIIGIVAEQLAVGHNACIAILAGNGGGRPDGVGDAPSAKMLARALGQVLPLGNAVQLSATFQHDRAHAAQRQINRQPQTDWPAPDNRNGRVSHGFRPRRRPGLLRRSHLRQPGSRPGCRRRVPRPRS